MKGEDTRLELFSPVHSRSAADEVLAVMVDALRGGLFDAGDILPSQASLAHRLKVSRRVLREAIEVLREEGIEDLSGNMPQRAQRIVEAVGMIWDPAKNSSIETTSGGGSTVTLPGLKTILAAVQTRDAGGITEADEALRVGSAIRAAEPLPLGRPCVPAPVKVVSIEAERAVRDPRVVHAVLVRADSRCESCGDEAPFVRDDGTPFLEVHHMVPLSNGGSDRQENALVCCPNCHRAFHFADDQIARTERAYLENIGLIREL